MNKKKTYLLFLLLFFVQSSFSQKYIYSQYVNEEEKLPKVSDLWRAGEYLIYDCFKQSYICVSKKSYALCETLRGVTRNKKEVVLACAPLKKYKKYETCLEALYLLIHRVTDKRFCRNFESAL